MPNLKNIQKQAAALMGFSQQSMGKTQARKEFFPLVDALSSTSAAIEITDHDRPVAVILSYQNYIALTAKLCMLSKGTAQTASPNLIGSIKILTHDLEAASEEIAAVFANYINETAAKL